MNQKFHEPFSPAILETTVPHRFVRVVNDVSDDVLSSDEKSKKWDWSHKLVGKVNKEILIPVTDKDDRAFLFKTMKQGCLDYLNHMIQKNRNNPWTRMDTGREPTIDNIHLFKSIRRSSFEPERNCI